MFFFLGVELLCPGETPLFHGKTPISVLQPHIYVYDTMIMMIIIMMGIIIKQCFLLLVTITQPIYIVFCKSQYRNYVVDYIYIYRRIQYLVLCIYIYVYPICSIYGIFTNICPKKITQFCRVIYHTWSIWNIYPSSIGKKRFSNIAMEAMAHRNRWFTYEKW